MPAWATRPIQERFSGGIARYHGSVSSMRAMACGGEPAGGLLQPPQGRGVGVDVRARGIGLAVFGFGHGTRLPYRDGARAAGSRGSAAVRPGDGSTVDP